MAHIIKKYYTQADNQEDLISIGTIGLIKAVNTFKADKGIRLATYASRCIENEILMHFRLCRKMQGEVSLSDTIETDSDGGDLYLSDVVGENDSLLEDLQAQEERLLVRRFEEFYRRIGVNADAERTQRIYEYELGCRSYYLDGAEALLKALVQGGYRIYLASNGTTVVQSPGIKASGLDRICHGIFLSEAIGCDKPQKAFFDACFESIENFVPENAIILGDSLSSDIAGGRNAGIKTCWFNPKKLPLTGDVIPDYEISELSEFLEILKA